MAAVDARPGRLRVALALAAVWVIWGATYVGIRVAVETIPPFLAASARFLLAAAVLASIVAVRRGPAALVLPRRELVACALAGALLLGGVGAMMVGEQEVASNLAALIGSGSAFWVVLVRVGLREPVPRGTLLGVPLGLAGLVLVLLVGTGEATEATAFGVLACLVSTWLWTSGSVVSTRLPLPRDMLVTGTWESVAGAAVLLPLALVTGEPDGFSVEEVSGRSLVALLFLALAGSVVAFTAYAWLLQHVPISTAVTNQYVNPIVALTLGWLVLGERLGPSMLVGAVLVIGAVALIVRSEARARADA